MPGDNDINIVPVAGLIAGGHSTLASDSTGYMCFVKGGRTIPVEDAESQSDGCNPRPLSKDARVAKLYQELVFRPFIEKIRKVELGWDGGKLFPVYFYYWYWARLTN